MARLIRTEKEVEGRYEEVWVVVDEDALDQWPAGPLSTVGRRVPRIDGVARVRGEAPFTADLQLPGMLHTAVLRSPYARARVTSIDLEPARSAWATVDVPSPGLEDNTLESVVSVGPDDAWAVGDSADDGVSSRTPVTVRWDGPAGKGSTKFSVPVR